MFKPVESRVSFPQLEETILELWQKNDIFNRSIAARKSGPGFILYDGPPTVNGSPALHHVFMSVFKDVIPRYKTMKGFYAPRIAGWDTHGLPVELEIEKQLGFSSKKEIEEYGIDRFNGMCRENVFKYLGEFESILKRVGYWVDFNNAYITLSPEYIESCWWAIKKMWDDGRVYQGYRVTPHCPRCGTSLSSHEVAQGYKEDTEDPSVYIKFKVAAVSLANLPSDLPVFLLAWTTTPWTLPGNTALAVAPDAEYVILKGVSDYLVMAARLVGTLKLEGYREVGKVIGNTLSGVKYEPLFNPHDFDVERRAFFKDGSLKLQKPAKKLTYRVICGDFVTLDDGTGIVHVAPAFGEVDFEAGKEWDLDFVQPVDLQGRMTGRYKFAGRFVKDADPIILEDLKSRGLLFRWGSVRHTYPFCWRCETPLLYYAKTTWYIRTTAVKERLISGNEGINWYPEHIKYGRFGDWLENNIDWAFSRERYWGTPLPVWRCEKCAAFECIGGIEDLRKKPQITGLKEPLDLHRPYVDAVTFACSKCGGMMRRVPEVIDCWFDSGCMPFAQFGFPHANIRKFDSQFPADFICEAVDQTRGWFYSLHAISTLLFGRPCYKNVICLGHILDAKGEKMSKRKGNIVLPWEVVKKYGADALRWYLYTGSAPGNPRQFDARQVDEVSRRFLSTLWNVYSFFVMYANIDKYRPPAGTFAKPEAELDRWILSELNQLIVDVDASLDAYSPTDASRRIETFVDALSNWYVRRSRRRFWKSENDVDKLVAYNTLYHCLVTLAGLLAPFTPFLAEALYQNLVRSFSPDAPESVHLKDFPVADISSLDKALVEDNRLAMRVCSLGRAARSQAGIKVRQPLAEIFIGVKSEREKRALERMAPLVLEELNIKGVEYDTVEKVAGKEARDYAIASDPGLSVAVSCYITAELEAEGMAREIVHRVQTMRRSAGYDIADHIVLYYEADAFIMQSLSSFADYVMQETLARSIEDGVPDAVDIKESFKVSGYNLLLGVKKAA